MAIFVSIADFFEEIGDFSLEISYAALVYDHDAGVFVFDFLLLALDEFEIENIFGDILNLVIVSRAGNQNESPHAAEKYMRYSHHAVRLSGVENFVHRRVRVYFFVRSRND